MPAVSFRSAPTSRDVFLVAVAVTLRARLTMTALAAGPVLWFVGLLASSQVVTRTGITLLPLAIGAVAVVLLAASYAAYRPGSSEVYAGARWTFDDSGIDIEGADGRRRAQWGDFRSWRTAGGCYVLHVTRSRYLVFPVRDVPEAQRAAFEDLLTGKLGPRRR